MNNIFRVAYVCTPNYKNIAKEELETYLEDDVQEDTSLENLTMIFWALCEIIQTSKLAAQLLTK